MVLTYDSYTRVMRKLRREEPPTGSAKLGRRDRLIGSITDRLDLQFLFVFFLSLFESSNGLVIIDTRDDTQVANEIRRSRINIFLRSLLLYVALFVINFRNRDCSSLVLLFRLSRDYYSIVNERRYRLRIVFFTLSFLVHCVN